MEQRVTTNSQYSVSANVTGIKNMEAQTPSGISLQKIYFQPDVNVDLRAFSQRPCMPLANPVVAATRRSPYGARAKASVWRI
jgi:hypothetical protein